MARWQVLTLLGGVAISVAAWAQHAAHQPATAPAAAAAVAVVHPLGDSKVRGLVRFSQTGQQVRIVAQIEGLAPGGKHAIHIHEYGDCSSPDGMSAGGHYNPENHPHGLPDQEPRHAGDFGNLQANDKGIARLELAVNNLSIAGHHNPIIGRAVIIHAKPDDGGQPVGNAGGRIACGVIGLAKAQ